MANKQSLQMVERRCVEEATLVSEHVDRTQIRIFTVRGRVGVL